MGRLRQSCADSAVLPASIAALFSRMRARPAPPQLEIRSRTVYNPFISHDFLSALEDSKSVGGRTGWQPQHLLAETPDGTLVAAAPCYVKSHSRGEYVFDRGWAEAYERAGGSYYPKLQVAVPFTPATGRRLLVRAAVRMPTARRPRAGARPDRTVPAVAAPPASTSPSRPKRNAALLGELGYLQRTDQQFHWENAGFASFDDFLAALTARKRKTIRRERQRRAGERHHRALAHRQRSHRRRVGRVLRVLHGDRLAQMGPALSDPRRSIRWSARQCATASCW